jgi:hypothetical protein
MAVAIAGVSEQVVGRSAQFVEAIRTAIRTHLGVEPYGTGPAPSAVRAA